MNIGKRVLGTFAIPVMTLLVVLLISAANGIDLFASEGNWITFFRAIANVTLITFALSLNLNSGRFDFSIGSVALLGSVISSMLCIKFGWGAPVMLFLSLLVGLFFGFLSGLVYVIVKLPPIIVSLAMALLYEGLAFAITGGYGVSFVNNTELVGFPSVGNYLLITIAAVVVMVVIFDHTEFGFNYKALLSGQKVSVNTGIREIGNTLGCYAIAGALMGVQGFIASTNTGTIQMALNFGSIGTMFAAFLPMFIGGYIGRFTNDKIGYLLGAVSMAIVSLAYVRLNLDSSVQQIISALLLVGFLIYLNNEGKLIELKMLAKRNRK